MENKIKSSLNNFLGDKIKRTPIGNGMEEVCDLQTGRCYTIKSKDGLVERVNKTYIVEDGRQLIID